MRVYRGICIYLQNCFMNISLQSSEETQMVYELKSVCINLSIEHSTT